MKTYRIVTTLGAKFSPPVEHFITADGYEILPEGGIIFTDQNDDLIAAFKNWDTVMIKA